MTQGKKIKVYHGTTMNRFFRGYDYKTKLFDIRKVPGLESRKFLIDFFEKENIELDWISSARSSAKNAYVEISDQPVIVSGIVNKSEIRRFPTKAGVIENIIEIPLPVLELYSLEDLDPTLRGLKGLKDISETLKEWR